MVRPPPKYGAFDRMEIEFAGPNVLAMAQALHRQVGLLRGPIDVEAVAYELDILEIREEPLDNIEGALLATPDKAVGSILVNRRSGPRRRRFTIAHELCHLLHAQHHPQSKRGFICSSADMRVRRFRPKPGLTRHERQEWQANRFAIEMLVPEHLLTRHLEEQPCIQVVLEISREFDISREAAARHYVEKSDRPIAVVFSHNARVRYSISNSTFPPLAVSSGDPLTLQLETEGEPSPTETVDPIDWLRRPDGEALLCQSLAQQDGYAMTLLTVDETDN